MSALMNRFRRKDVGETNEEYIRRLNYDELEEKYDIHKYYPQYIHNGEISTPQLRAMLKDKPIYHKVKPQNKPAEKAKVNENSQGISNGIRQDNDSGNSGRTNGRALTNYSNGLFKNGGKAQNIMRNGHGHSKVNGFSNSTHANTTTVHKLDQGRTASSTHKGINGGEELGGYAERSGSINNPTATATSMGTTLSGVTINAPITIPNGNSGNGSKFGNLFRNPFKDLLGTARSFDQSKSEMTLRRKLELKEDSDKLRRNSAITNKVKGNQVQAPPGTRVGTKMIRIRGNSASSHKNDLGYGLAAAQGKGMYQLTKIL